MNKTNQNRSVSPANWSLQLSFGLSLIVSADRALGEPKHQEWQSLFNGRDLSGWNTFLGSANPGETNYGLNLDPEKVFSVSQVDGTSAIHISGKYWGGIITTQEFANYHLRLEYKWGQKIWPPRLNDPRDSGICYHCVGPLAADPVYPWPRSFEFNIAERDVGEFWSVDYTIVDAEVVPIGESPNEQAAFKAWCKRNGADKPKVRFQKGGRKHTFRGGGFMPAGDLEKPAGQWNVLDLYAVGDRSVHVVNGKVAVVLTGLRQTVDGKEIPLTRGRIELQTESAEIFFRNIQIRHIGEIPKEVLE
jgi:hypothetical protein